MPENNHFIPTLAYLRERVYKTLELHTVNGEPVSEALGVKADIARRFTETLRHALMRIAVRFPLKRKQFTLTTESVSAGVRTAVLPETCFRVLSVTGADGIVKKSNEYSVSDSVLTIRGGDETVVIVCQTLPMLHDAAPEDTPIDLPPLTYEALVLLTAMLLCPAENSALYERIANEYASVYSDTTAENAKTVDRVRNTLFDGARRSRVCPA